MFFFKTAFGTAPTTCLATLPSLNITDATFEEEVIKSDTPVLVDFWAEWCGPCKMIAPLVDELAEEFDGRVKFTKLDVDSNPMTAQLGPKVYCAPGASYFTVNANSLIHK